MSQPTLDRTYRAGVALATGRVVCRNSSGSAVTPGEGDFTPEQMLGVTTQSQSRIGSAVPVRVAGIAEAETIGAIPTGSPVTIGDDDGRVRAAEMPEVFFAGTETNRLRIIARRILPHLENFTFRTITPVSSNAPLVLQLSAGDVVAYLATDGDGDATTTLALLRAALIATPLAHLFSISVVGSGAESAREDEVTISGFLDELPIIGIAEGSALEEGDLIPIRLH